MVEALNAQSPQLLAKAHEVCREWEKQDKPLGLTYLVAVCACAIIAVGVIIEVANFAFALRQFYPALSSGDSYGPIIALLKFALGAAIIMVHVLLRQASNRFGQSLNRWLDILGLVSVVLLLAGAMFFLPSSFNAANGEAGSANAPWSLSIVLMALFPISMLSNHSMLGVLASALLKIEGVRNTRNKVAQLRGLIAGIEQQRRIASNADDQIEAVKAKREGLDWNVATEFAAVVGDVAATINDHIVVRETFDGTPADANLRLKLPEIYLDMPIQKMREMRDYLAGFTTHNVFQTIKARGV